MAYVATQPLQWGEETIAAGALVPADEPGRDYGTLLHLGQIREVDDTAGLSDEQAAKALGIAMAERDKLAARVAELEADDEEEIPPVEIPEGVVPGETPGWPLVVLPFTDEQRDLMAGAGLSGTFTAHELRDKLDELRAAAGAGGTTSGEGSADEAGDAGAGGDAAAAAEGEGEGDARSAAGADAAGADDALPEGVVETSPGWFQVPGSDRSVRRRDIAAALAEAKG